MENRIIVIESKITELEKIKNEFYDIKNTVTRMEMVDKNIYDKLEMIDKTMISHKDNFLQHDINEMEKYGSIDKRLIKIERIMYMGMGALVVVELLSKLHLLSFGN